MELCSRKCVTVLILCILWHLVSSSSKLLEKKILNLFGYPMSLTLVQLFLTAALTWPLVRFECGSVQKGGGSLGKRHWLLWVLPLAVGKIVTTVFAHLSVQMGTVSFAHTVKASMPIFTVLFARILFKEKQTLLVYSSLPLIIAGVAIASFTEAELNYVSLISALIATCGFVLQNIFNKRLLKETGIHTFELVLVLSQVSFLIFFPIWVVTDLRNIINDHPMLKSTGNPTDWPLVSGLLIVDGVLNFSQNLLAFKVLAMVNPLTYSVVNSSKRIEIIAFSIIFFGNYVSPWNIFGIALAISGVFFYTYAKHRSNKAKAAQSKASEALKSSSAEPFIEKLTIHENHCVLEFALGNIRTPSKPSVCLLTVLPPDLVVSSLRLQQFEGGKESICEEGGRAE